MAEFPYTPNPASLEKFLATIQSIGRPQKVTQKWLTGIGYKSSNDRYILPILKALGFIDGSGTPLERWMAYRNKEQSRGVLARAIKEAYPSLFETYPDAYRKDDEALRNFFSTHTTVGEKAISFIVRTFKALVLLADFETPIDVSAASYVQPAQSANLPLAQQPTTRGINLTLNIQLQLPATDDASIYEKLFEAMKKHLMS